MFKTILTFTVILAVSTAMAQQTIYDTLSFQGLDRSYILYVPASYNSSLATPLILNFHGYTSNAGQQMFYGDFRSIADSAGFIVVHPNGTKDATGTTYWNSGWGGTVDDVGFTETLIDSLAAQYSIDLERVYSTGMSNGGFMSYYLACNLSNRIAAIASVTGSMNVNQTAGCNVQHAMPVMEIHGTSDPTVPYTGISGQFEGTSNVVSYWVSHNSCDVNPVMTNVPDIDLLDLCTAEHSVYKNGAKGVEVEHYKVLNGGHTWPGSAITIGTTNQDFDASTVIWNFFSKYDINGLITPSTISIKKEIERIDVFPNPASDKLFLGINSNESHKVEVHDMLGTKHLDLIVSKRNNKLSINTLSKGYYLLSIYDVDGGVVRRSMFMKQ